jgi:CRP/FNR family transcriptional regulator, anaerobic regulatory protein
MPRTISCHKCPLRDSGLFRGIDECELDFMESFKLGELTADAGSPLMLEGANAAHLFTLFHGWAFRYKTLPDGRRQVVNFLMRGDFIGLQASLFESMGHGIESLTPVRLCVFPRDRLWGLFEKHAGLAFDVTWLAAREERALDDQLLTVGRRTALEKLAFTIWFLYSRAERVGLVNHSKLDLPVTQQHLADAIGMSVVHTNKTLQRLRSTRCISWSQGVLEMLDEDKLLSIAKAGREELPVRPLI